MEDFGNLLYKVSFLESMHKLGIMSKHLRDNELFHIVDRECEQFIDFDDYDKIVREARQVARRAKCLGF
jgi:hypothetical protein